MGGALGAGGVGGLVGPHVQNVLCECVCNCNATRYWGCVCVRVGRVRRGAAGSREKRPRASIIREKPMYLVRPCRWEPDKSKDTAARARSSCVRPSKRICRAPTRARMAGAKVSTERWNSSALPWPLWVNLHRRSVVVSVAMWSVMSQKLLVLGARAADARLRSGLL